MAIRVHAGTVYVNEVFSNGPASNSGMIEKGEDPKNLVVLNMAHIS